MSDPEEMMDRLRRMSEGLASIEGSQGWCSLNDEQTCKWAVDELERLWAENAKLRGITEAAGGCPFLVLTIYDKHEAICGRFPTLPIAQQHIAPSDARYAIINLSEGTIEPTKPTEDGRQI